MRHILPFAAICAALAFIPVTGFAESLPRPGGHDSRIRYITYREGDVVRINTSLKHITLIELDPGEVITSTPAGDTASFKIYEIDHLNAFTVKPLHPGSRTNVVVETNRRFYHLELRESPIETYYSVRLTMPENRRGNGTGKLAPAPVDPHIYRALSDTRGKEFAPDAVWDDGRKTYFRFGPDAPIPAVFRADAKGRESTVNTSVTGTTITVAGRSNRWVLRHGDQYICIEGS